MGFFLFDSSSVQLHWITNSFIHYLTFVFGIKSEPIPPMTNAIQYTHSKHLFSNLFAIYGFRMSTIINKSFWNVQSVMNVAFGDKWNICSYMSVLDIDSMWQTEDICYHNNTGCTASNSTETQFIFYFCWISIVRFFVGIVQQLSSLK